MAPRFGLASAGFHRRPFRLTPDPAVFCATPTHASAAAALGRAFRDRDAVAVIDGEAGTGKTRVAVRFLDALPPDTPRVMIAAPRQAKAGELFQAILFDLGRPYQGLTEHELRLAVTAELLAAAEANRRLVLFVDEAHNLSPDAVEELRLLGNVESPDGPAAFVLLAGLPGLRSLIAANPSLAHRVSARCRLQPLSADESRDYLREQLRACGGRAEWVFADEALALIAELSSGVPRVLNRLAGLALTTAEAEDAEWVDAEAVLTAAAELELTPAEVRPVSTAEVEPTAPDEPDPLPHPNQVPRPPKSLAGRHAKPRPLKRQAA